VPLCKLQTSHIIPCIEGDKLWCYHGKNRPFDFANGLLVNRLSKRGDVGMDGLPNAEKDGLRVIVSLTACEATLLELEVFWAVNLLLYC
jgi:hypothetical protein